jgi:hypothetical protein
MRERERERERESKNQLSFFFLLIFLTRLEYMKYIILIVIIPFLLWYKLNNDDSNFMPTYPAEKDNFVEVKGTRFYLAGTRYMIKGANYWQGINLATLDGGDRDRLNLELDQLLAIGCNNLRIMAGTVCTSLSYISNYFNIQIS